MLRNITILKAKGPDQFWVKEVPGPNMSSEAQEFQDLTTRINAYCGTNDTIMDQLQAPSRGQYCLARRTADRTWYRAKIDSMLQTSHGTQAKCLLVDYAETILVSVHRMCEIPEEFLQLPFQSKECSLHGIQPLTLSMSFEDFTTVMKPCQVWDTSAVEYFNDMIKDKSAQMTVHRTSKDGIQFITLYINTREGQVNVNDELIRREFATIRKRDDLVDYEERAPSPAPSLESLQLRNFDGSTSSREGSIRALSPEIGAHALGSRRISPPLATRQVLPTPRQNEMDERHALKERFQETLKLHKVSPEGLLEKSRHDEQEKERLRQKSPGHPMEVLSTAEVREKIQQLGKPLTQSRTVPNMNSEGGQNVSVQLKQEGSESIPSSDSKFSPVAAGNSRTTASQKSNSPSPTSGAFGQTPSPPRGRGMVLEKFYQMAGSSGSASCGEKKRESLSPVGSFGRISPADGISPRGAGLNSSPEILQVAKSKSALSPRSPLTSDFSSGDDGDLNKKQRALALLQRMATVGEARLSSEEDGQRMASANSVANGRKDPPVTSPEQNRVQSPSAESRDSPAITPESNINRPPFHIRPPSSGSPTVSGDQNSPEGVSHPKTGADRGAIRKSFAAKSSQRESSGWSSDYDKQTSCSSSDEVGNAVSPLSEHIVEQRLNRLLHQPANKQLAILKRTNSRPPSHGVLVHGEMPPEPFLHFDDAPFPEPIFRVLQRANLAAPYLIQKYAWPAILRGRNTVGVAPVESGKRLAYLLPLITQVMQPSVYYSSLPLGHGPIVVVVCPGWRRAADTYDQCMRFLGKNRKPRALLLHGAGLEEHNQVQLVNGVDILVVTISCLLRLLEGDHTNLNRLCHLVLDDADILFDDFTDEIKKLMGHYGGALIGRKTTNKAPEQQIVFSSKWTPGISSYLRQFMADPVVVITVPLEAAVYARVKWMAKITSNRQRFQHLISVLDSCQASASKAVVFVNSRTQAEDLQKMLVNSQYYSLLAHGEMGSHHIDNVVTEWRATHRGDSVPVLVMTDDVMQELRISNASCVIHYDFATNKATFGRRLGSMMDNFATQIDQAQKSNCQCLLLLSEKEHMRYIPSVAKLLSRCSRDMTSQLRLDDIIKAKESKKLDMDLCQNVKGRGYCWDFPKCHDRHQVKAEVDTPGSQSLYLELPQSGIVKILFTHIVHASCYYGRILEYRATEESDPVDMTTKYAQLPMDMTMWFTADEANKQAHGSPKVNQLCAYEDDQRAYHRVRIVSVNKNKGVLKNVKVQFVDEGRYLDISATKLLKLPARFHSTPFQAVEVYICRVKPMDKDREYTDEASRHIDNMIYKKTLEGKIALSLGNSLWVDPLVERVFLQDVGSMVNATNIRQELLEKGFAEDNPEHMSKIRELCEGEVALPQLVPSIRSTETSTILRPDTETIIEAVLEVYVSAVASLNLFYVQKCSTFPKLERLMSSIETKMDSVRDDSNEWHPQQQDICLAKFPIDGRWGRGRIVSINDSGEFDVFFVDYGDQIWISRADIRQPWNDILKLPFQALECSLVDVGPVSDKLEEGETEGDAFWYMCSDGEEEDHKILTLKVKSTMSGQFSGMTCYIVDLYDELSTERSINIGQQLVHEGHGKGVQDFVQGMFPDAVGEKNSISGWLIKLCRELYQTKEKKRQMDLARTIHQLVTNKRCNPRELCEEGALVSLCHLVCMGQIDDSVINNLLVRSLIHVCHNRSRNCKEMCKHGGLKEICNFLPKTEEQLLQEQICWILMTAAEIGAIVKKCIREYGGVLGLCNLLTSDTQSLEVINSACASIAVLATDNPRNQDLIKQAGGVTAVCQMLTRTSCDITRKEVLYTLSVLASHIKNRDGMRTEGGLQALCELLWESKDEQVIFMVTNTLLSLVDNVANKTVMLEEELIECLEEYMLLRSSPFQDTTMQSISLLHGVLTERDRNKRITSDNLEEFGLLPVNDNQSVNNSRQVGQSQITSAPPVNQSNETVPVNGHIETREAVVEIPDDLPPLEEDDNLPTTATPRVKWAQRPNSISLSVDLRGVQDFEVEVFRKSITFSTNLDDVLYGFHLNLFSQVSTLNYTATASGGEVLITLYKETPGNKWPRLTNSKGKFGFLSLDFDRWEDDSTSDEDPRFAKKKSKAVADKAKSSKHKVKVSKSGASYGITPEMDTSSESDDSDYSHSTRSSDAEFGFADESDPMSTMMDSS